MLNTIDNVKLNEFHNLRSDNFSNHIKPKAYTIDYDGYASSDNIYKSKSRKLKTDSFYSDNCKDIHFDNYNNDLV
jgi:hypothetical protein